MKPSKKLIYYQSLLKRTDLTETQHTDYITTMIGYEGEAQFESYLKQYDNILYLHDITLHDKYLGSAQFDFLVFYNDTITHYDTKNFKGEYELIEQNFINPYGNNVKNPDLQLDRAHKILKQVLEKNNLRYNIESRIVFINENFHFKGDTRNHRWIFRSMIPSRLKPYEKPNFYYEFNMEHCDILETLDSPIDKYIQPIRSEFTMAWKGLKCCRCRKRIDVEENGKHTYTCPHCGGKYRCKEMLLHNIKELYILKGSPITSNEAMEWCETNSRTAIYRLLKKNFKTTGQRNGIKYYL